MLPADKENEDNEVFFLVYKAKNKDMSWKKKTW